MKEINIVWFRRDLRLNDHVALFHAQQKGLPILPIFIFDQNILNELKSDDRRVAFIYQRLKLMNQQLLDCGSSMLILKGNPLNCFKKLSEEYKIRALFFNHDYEPYALKRDAEIHQYCVETGIHFQTFKDHVIFEKDEIVKSDGLPYTVFTPYSKKWKLLLEEKGVHEYSMNVSSTNYFKEQHVFPSLKELGFENSQTDFPAESIDEEIISKYHLQRDIPGIKGTSRLSVHLRFGTISIRSLVNKSRLLNEKFLNELIWRDFYQSILWHFPHVVHKCFRPAYESILWRNNEEEFYTWCEGKTGYPLVDAGMRELNETGWMHNRVRMVVASFLSKHLLIDWRWGEAYFASKLLDFDLASNNGGWQWAAGSGVDAAPYFRVFNPSLQAQKFDPALAYIHKWIPELDTFDYPKPMVVHEFARERCLTVYKKALQGDITQR